jgi:hypothetical protein
MNFQSRFSLSKFIRIFLGRTLLIGGPGVMIFIFTLLAYGQILSDSTPDLVKNLVMLIVISAVFTSIFIAPAFFIGPLNQFRKSNIQYVNGKIMYCFLKSSFLFSYSIYNIYTVNAISNIKVTSKKIIIEGDISLEVMVNNRCKKEKIMNSLKIPNVFDGIEWMSTINTNDIITRQSK